MYRCVCLGAKVKSTVVVVVVAALRESGSRLLPSSSPPPQLLESPPLPKTPVHQSAPVFSGIVHAAASRTHSKHAPPRPRPQEATLPLPHCGATCFTPRDIRDLSDTPRCRLASPGAPE
ncbi:hypothetical protein E2C01_013668 [Portunus trituberculatus]|uniref:Uncharacterized protein n=1 Tax=Portunus trituberculatus TaxID=210409 RepID=A0A5B7DHU3_PORTR|nr:hypothetical protein [Portunus trituberculatus]